jgi:tol-pal system protein YbgF
MKVEPKAMRKPKIIVAKIVAPKIIAALLICLTVSPAFAGTNKDMIQLQTQIQQLQDAVARLQQSNDERMGVLKDLVQQSADSVNRLSVNMDALQKQFAAQQAAEGAKVDTVSGQVQALNDSLDEIKARMARLEKAMNEVQGSAQNINAALQNLPQNGGQPGGQPATQSPAQQGTPAPGPQSLNTSAPAPVVREPAPPVNAAPPVDDLYRAAYNDYIAAKYGIATSEFLDVIKNYPDNNLSGNAYYYIGEIDYRAGKYTQAAKDYDKVLEQFPDSNKVPASRLHKGEALIQMHQNEAGIRELRALIQRFPVSPEATQARSRLNGMGVPIHPRA